MLTENHVREGLSAAYIQAVAFRAGYSCSARTHDYGIDGSINDVQVRAGDPRRRFETGFGIDLQAKAWQNGALTDATVRYDLEARSQQDLVETHRGRPLILVVLALPEDPEAWLTVTPEHLLLRRCAWWTHLRGQAPTTNEQRVRVALPRSNVFDVAAVQGMMARVRAGGWP
ncbi:MAG: DUF4365 domain-containing protein [Deltaproteobacteria bacterium]|nr:DUF4365 domain-containing protein [Deltaproteobacteria bacterium]